MRLLVTSGAGIVTSSLIARTLGPDEMGLYAYAVWIGAVLLSVAHGGIPTTMTRFIAEASARGEGTTTRALFTRLLLWQVVLALIVCAGGGLYSCRRSPGPQATLCGRHCDGVAAGSEPGGHVCDGRAAELWANRYGVDCVRHLQSGCGDHGRRVDIGGRWVTGIGVPRDCRLGLRESLGSTEDDGEPRRG